MKLDNILVVRKKTTYEIQALERKEPRFLDLLAQNHESIRSVLTAHQEHCNTIDIVQKALNAKNLNYKLIDRFQLDSNIKDYDLVISVGGDGTLLDISHFICDKTPILGVNSSTSSSFGHFCLANFQNFDKIIESIINDNIKHIPILRLMLKINKKTVSELILNEVLIAHPNPAATSRYILNIDEKKEDQRSSGIIVSTPAGSTGTYRACSGKVMPIDSLNYAYYVREPGLRPFEKWNLLHNQLSYSDKIHLISKMRQAKAYIDGPHLSFDICLGDEIIIEPSPKPLHAYIDINVNEQFK